MKKKKIRRTILYSLAIAIILGGLYGYKEYTRKVKDLSKVKADVQVEATDLIAAFEKNEAKGNEKYLDKIIEVKGTVRELDKSELGHYSIILGEENSMSSVRCSMDSTHQEDAASLVKGSKVIVKGACTGFNADDLLGSDVILNRCVITD